MKNINIKKNIEGSIEATTLIVDLRNFTPNLNASREGEDGINSFCHFLSEFYADCLEACLIALPPSTRNLPPLYLSSTGDGALIVFSGEWHFCCGFLAGITLDAALKHRCEEYNKNAQKNGLIGTSYGIGIESGTVNRIKAQPIGSDYPVIDTYIGHCINISARAESLSKTLYQANTVVSDTVVELVAEALYKKTFQDLRNRELQCSSDSERLLIHDEMNQLNHDLSLASKFGSNYQI